jgi:hypothetical protein
LRLLSFAPDGSGESSVSASFAGPRLTPTGVLRFALALLCISSLGNLPILDLGSRQAPLFLNDVLVMGVVVIGAVAMANAQSLKLDDVALAALMFVAIGALSAAAAMPRFGLTAFEVIASLAYLARWIVYFCLYLVMINCVRRGDVGPIWSALEWTMIAFAAFGVFQSAFLPNFGQMIHPEAKLYLEIDPQGHRLMSTILEPNIAAAMILTVLLVQIAQLACGAHVPRWKPALLLLALVLTLSRSGVLAFVFGLMVILAARGLGKKMVRFLMAMGILAILALPQLLRFASQYSKLGISDGSAAARFVIWQRSIATFLESPWFGVGFNTYGYVQERRGFERFGSATYSAEGGLLFIAVMTGIVGLIVYGTMLWFVARRMRAVWRSPDATAEERGLAVGAAAATMAIVVHSTFVNSLLTPFVMEPLWVLWGLGFIVAGGIRRRRMHYTAT